MPPKGYKNISIKQSLYDELEKLAHSLKPNRSVADTIKYLLTRHKGNYAYRKAVIQPKEAKSLSQWLFGKKGSVENHG